MMQHFVVGNQCARAAIRIRRHYAISLLSGCSHYATIDAIANGHGPLWPIFRIVIWNAGGRLQLLRQIEAKFQTFVAGMLQLVECSMLFISGPLGAVRTLLVTGARAEHCKRPKTTFYPINV